MKKNFYIFVLTFLCLLCGEMGYAGDVYRDENTAKGGVCDLDSVNYSFCECNGLPENCETLDEVIIYPKCDQRNPNYYNNICECEPEFCDTEDCTDSSSLAFPCVEQEDPVCGEYGESAYLASCGCIGGNTGIDECPEDETPPGTTEPPCKITSCPTGYELVNSNLADCECVKVCIEDANDKIKQITEGEFAKIVGMFNNPNSPFKVNISVGSLGGSTDLGRTVLSGTLRTYNIILNEDFPDATSLSIQASILHEYIHAFFNTLYDDWKNNRNTHAYDGYDVLKSYYLKDPKEYWSTFSKDAHHEQIAESFVDNIAAALQELNPTLPPEYCRDMAWSTMQGTPAYSSDAYLTPAEKERIGKERWAELNNKQRDTYTPKGNPCNK